MAVGVAFLLVVFSSHLPAAPVPGRDRLRQARRLAAAAVAAEAADHKRPVVSGLHREVHPQPHRQQAAA